MTSGVTIGQKIVHAEAALQLVMWLAYAARGMAATLEASKLVGEIHLRLSDLSINAVDPSRCLTRLIFASYRDMEDWVRQLWLPLSLCFRRCVNTLRIAGFELGRDAELNFFGRGRSLRVAIAMTCQENK